MDSARTNGRQLNEPTLPYEPTLDGLRGLAILLVITDHALWYGGGGAAGVQIFFALSGFLITSLLMRERDVTGTIAWRRFYARRIRRLAPALVAVVLVVGVVRATSFGVDQVVGEAAPVLLYFQNWVRAADPGFGGGFGHAWSLAIEEQFYVVWPVVMLLAPRRWLVMIAVAGVAIGVGSRVLLALDDASVSRLYFGTDTRLDGLMLGAAVALISPRGRPSRWMVAIAGAAIAAGVLLADVVVAPAVVAVATVVIILGRPGVLALAPLVWIGRLSYGLYLWHWPIMIRAEAGPWPLLVAMSFGAAWLSYSLIEMPFRAGQLPSFRVPRPASTHRRSSGIRGVTTWSRHLVSVLAVATLRGRTLW
jgi:peptidoglycan/LPS O-acetylase OafA/YrhL